MPFKSEAQRRFLWAKHPDIAKRWSQETKSSHAEAAKRRLSSLRKEGNKNGSR
jgi:hypothetical protein